MFYIEKVNIEVGVVVLALWKRVLEFYLADRRSFS